MRVLIDSTMTPVAPDLWSMIGTFTRLMLILWPLWVLVGALAFARLAFDIYRLRRLARSGIREVDVMQGHTFEEFLGTLFRRLGYAVENTRYRGDYGADLVVSKDGLKTAVQAKRWTKRIGVKAVQEAVASQGYYNCHRALVVANRDFTKQARVLARANNVELWDRETLLEKLLTLRDDDRRGASEFRSAPVKAVETNSSQGELGPDGIPDAADGAHCVTCGVRVSEKVRDYCLARPQRFGGRIFCFTHQRSVRAALT
jgi:restriction system protein